MSFRGASQRVQPVAGPLTGSRQMAHPDVQLRIGDDYAFAESRFTSH